MKLIVVSAAYAVLLVLIVMAFWAAYIRNERALEMGVLLGLGTTAFVAFFTLKERVIENSRHRSAGAWQERQSLDTRPNTAGTRAGSGAMI